MPKYGLGQTVHIPLGPDVVPATVVETYKGIDGLRVVVDGEQRKAFVEIRTVLGDITLSDDDVERAREVARKVGRDLRVLVITSNLGAPASTDPQLITMQWRNRRDDARLARAVKAVLGAA